MVRLPILPIVQEFVGGLYAIQLQCSLGMLAFDASWAEAKKAHDEAQQVALTRLRKKLVIEPKEWKSVLTAARADIQRAVEGACAPQREKCDLRPRDRLAVTARSPILEAKCVSVHRHSIW